MAIGITTTALRGAGGYGKTLLARALCHEPRVRATFPDGILWITLGETPDVPGGAIKILKEFTGERPNLVDVEDAAQELARTLDDKRCLLVLDDVWNEAHLRPFLRGGQNCARLITTRNRDTLPANTAAVDVDAMRAEEAVSLLGAGLKTPPDAPLRALAAQLGEWPLLLKLVNGALRARVEQGQPVNDALAWVNRALDKRGLTAFDARAAASRDRAVALTLGVSLDLLEPDERARYEELAVPPEDVDIPLAALDALWGATGGLDDFDVEALCQRLADLSLVQSFDLPARVLRLHDVVRAYLLRAIAPDRLTDLRRRHALYFLEWATPRQFDFDTLEAELPNLRAGFAFATAEGTLDDKMVRAYGFTLFDMFQTRGYWDDVLAWMAEAARACERLGDQENLASCYTNIAGIHWDRGSYKEALAWLEKTAAIDQMQEDKAGLGNTYNAIGMVYQSLGVLPFSMVDNSGPGPGGG